MDDNEPLSLPPNSTSASVADLLEQEVADGKLVLSEMGKRMLAARRRIEQSGVPLLDREELDQERASRRGTV
jgi:hypothetical protein